MNKPFRDDAIILPSILISLREEYNMTQQDFVDRIYEFSGEEISLTKANVSLWETGRRPVPYYLHKIIAKVFNVTTTYLYGLTDDPKNDKPIPAKLSNRSSDKEIPIDKLRLYHGLPVFVAFTNFQAENGWALYDKRLNALVFTDNKLELNSQNLKAIKLYEMRPEYLCDYSVSSKMLQLSEAIKKNRVYIKMRTDNESICNIYDGFYRNNENYTAFISQTGLVLPYDGVGISYNIYSENYKDTI